MTKRLKMLPPTARPLAPRAAVAAGAERDRVRAAVEPWRKWYRSKEWRALRIRVAKRDGWTCQRTGVLLVGRHPAPNSLAVHHKVAHNGDRDLFFDEANCEAVSKEWHDTEGQREDKAARG